MQYRFYSIHARPHTKSKMRIHYLRENSTPKSPIYYHTVIVFLRERKYKTMDDVSSLSLEGYIFKLKGYCCGGGRTTVIIGVKSDGGAAALTGWILEIDPADPAVKKDLNLLSCEKRKGNGPWMPAAAENTTYELIGDIGVSGVLIQERVNGCPDTPETEFRIVLSGEIDCGCIKVAYFSGEDVFCTQQTLTPAPPERITLAPIEKSFCLYIVVTDGYKPLPGKTSVSVSKRGLFVAHERGEFKTEHNNYSTVRSVRSEIHGTVKIAASVPVESPSACGDTVEVFTCDCFELCETLGYSTEESAYDIGDIYIYPVKESYDLTLLNSRCGKSVYRLDGEYIIDCLS